MRAMRAALLSTSAFALVDLIGASAFAQTVAPATTEAALAQAATAPVATTPAPTTPQPAGPAPEEAPAIAPNSTDAPAEIDIPKVTVEGRQPKPARRTASGPSSPSVRAAAPTPATPTTTPAATTAANSPFAPSTMTSGQIQSSTSTSVSNLFFTMPGATSAGISTQSARPVLRGLSDAKVRVQENGVGSVDVSDIAQDHGVPIDPLALQKTEVFRGPAALRFGSQAVGGVVDVTNNRIPTAAPPGGLAAEMRSAVSSVDRGWESGLLLDAGSANVAVHADVYGRSGSDYGIPSYPYLVPPSPAPAFNGRQPNSSMQSAGAAIGGSYLFDGGYAGLSISRFTSDYYVPGIASAADRQHNDLEQTKIVSKGEYRPDAVAVTAVRYWLGYSDYRHDEIDLNQASSGNFQTIGATFKNHQTEGKVELETRPVATPLGALSSIFGAQAAYQQLDTSGQAILLPAQTTTAAGYFFEEMRHTDTLRTQLAGRIESVDVAGTAFAFPPNFLPPPNNPASSPSKSNFLPTSVSFGIIKDLPSYLQASLTLQRVQRAPRALELFASGSDDSEKTFKIGNADLTLETAKTAEIGLKRTGGDFRFNANLYYTYYEKFIYGEATGTLCGATFATCGIGADYIQVNYAQRDAVFRGGELSWQWDAAQLARGTFGIEGQFDIVRATFTDGANVPRIPPMRVGGGVYWRDDNWYARVNLLHAFAQNDIAAFDTTTASYDLLKFQIERRQRWKDSPWGAVDVTTGLVGDNLLNADIRNSVQFHKDEILQPGRTFKLFVNVKYGAEGPANASAGAVSGPAIAPFYKAPRADAWDWAGLYVGGNTGYAWGISGTYAGFIDVTTRNPVFGNRPSSHLDNASFGGQAGYNWTSGRLLAGIEGDFEYANQRGSITSACPGSICNPALAPLDARATASLDYHMGWVATVRGRLGTIVTPSILAYVTAGIPVARITTSGTVAGFDNNGSATVEPFTTETLRAGWTIGGGLEGRLFGNWTGKVEYSHMDFGSLRATPATPVNARTMFDSDARITSDVVRVGVNYQFGPTGAMAASD